jgi:hypothetical protein
MTPNELAAWLADAWRSNKSITDVIATLKKAGGTTDRPHFWFHDYLAPGQDYPRWLAIDLDGDGMKEWVLTILWDGGHFDAMYGDERSGELWIVGKKGVELQIGPKSPNTWSEIPPVIVAQLDLTGDGLPDLVTESFTMGFTTPSGTFHVISGHGGQIQNVIQKNQLSLAAANLQAKIIWDLDTYYTPPGGIWVYGPDRAIITRTGRLPTLILRSAGYVGPGAGPRLLCTQTWAWDGGAFTLARIQPDDSTLRIHILWEANFAFALDDRGTAIGAYERVIGDQALDDITDWSKVPTDDDARQFAAFRLALIYLKERNETRAGEWQDWLRSSYPEKPITRAADVLMANWQRTHDLQPACRAVTDFLKTQDDSTGELLDVGGANPALDAEDVCPVTQHTRS